MSEIPKHAFEVRLVIGGNTWDYVLRAVDDIRQHLEDCGEKCGMASGGWDGCHSVDIQRRDVTPDQYRDELEKWREEYDASRAAQPVGTAKPESDSK